MTLYPLTKPQQSIWNMEQYYGGSVANITGTAFFREPIDISTLQTAMNKTVEQCDSVRIRVKIHNGKPMQYIDPYKHKEYEVIRFADSDKFDAWVYTLARTPFDLDDALYKFIIAVIGQRVGFVIHLHHITADAWTLNLIANTIAKNLNNEDVHINSYIDYIIADSEYETSVRREKDRDYFLSCFKQCGEPIFLCDRQVKSIESDRLSFTLGSEDAARIQAFCKDNGLSPYTLFMCAFSLYIHRIKGAQDFYIGTTVLNRSCRKEKNTVGMFVNTVPVLFHIDEEKSALENIRSNTSGIFKVFRHQKYQYSEFLKDIREKYTSTEHLYDVTLNYQNAALTDGNRIDSRWHFCGYQGDSLSVHINDRQNEGAFHLDYDYQTELFTKRSIERLHGHLINLIFDIIANPNKMPRELKLLSDDEYQKVVVEFNDTATDYHKDKFIHQLFEEQAVKTPEATALIACDKTLTYKELNEQSNKIANVLIDNGIVVNDVIALVLPRRSYYIAAMLGILKSGGAYLPLDPNYPDDRIKFLLADSGAKLVITTQELVQKTNANVLLIEDLLTRSKVDNPIIYIEYNNLFCALHTSGSTGIPKVAGLTHKNVNNFALTAMKMFAGVETSLSTTTVSFDIFMQETLIALACGIRVTLFSEHEISNQSQFEKKVEQYDNCYIFQTPTKMESYIKNSDNKGFLQRIRTFVIGGEVFQLNLFELIHRYNSNNNIYNVYGPSENTPYSSVAQLSKWHFDNCNNSSVTNIDITIGKPIANTQIYILDKNLQPMPIGAVGELCISGDGAGRGYLNRPELTAEKFVQNPFVETSGQLVPKLRMYKTGDLARWREDGNIEYIGRMDNQVKIRGLRIELGEIETAIAKHEGIKQIAVVDRKDETGRQYICAYYISDSEIDEKALRSELAKTLPRYMIPHFFTRLDVFPTTPSGKTDRKAFPSPDFTQSHSDVEYIAPVTEQEKALIRVLEVVLNVSPVGMGDDFFDLGGDSLKAIEFVAKSQNEGFDFSLQDVFDHPTAASLLQHKTEETRQTTRYNAKDFTDIHQLLENNKIDGNPVPSKQPLGDTLITGATGWLGSHVLDEFLSSENGTAFCLVRGKDLTDSQNRLKRALKYYFGDKYANCGRIVVICGDITRKIEIDKSIDSVIHCAANVKHYGTYRDSHETNVVGTENIIALAKEKNAKLLHISTASVSGNSFEQALNFPPTVFDEKKLYIGQPLDNVYIRSKFEAEVAVLRARLDGLDAAVVRVGNLSNRYTDLLFQKNHNENATLTRLKAFAESGLFPQELANFELEFSPVNYTAKAIIMIAQNFDKSYSVFHAYNPNSVRFADFIRALKTVGVKMRSVSVEKFVKAVQGASHIEEAFIHDISKDSTLNFHSNITLSNDFTMWYLNQKGFDWLEIDTEYLTQYIKYFREIGYWEV